VTYNIALLRALASGQPVSGEALGRELGISRAAVWKGVRRLAALGLDIEAQAGRGYQLARPISLLDADLIHSALPEAVAARIARLEVLAETTSTNQRVLAAEHPLGELAACLAEYQSAGRGRRGRQWLSPPGAGICLSVGGCLPGAPSDYAAMPTAAGVACAAALEALGVPGVGLKWPNDLLLEGAKLGGILIELRGESQGPVTLAVGLGLNVRLGEAGRAAIASAGGLPAADLSAVAVERNALAAGLLTAISACLARPPVSLSEAVLSAWRKRDVLLGRTVSIDAPGGARVGIARGLDSSGALVLEGADGTLQRVTAGEATLRETSDALVARSR
jgi:BirA family transcriptional regulator, biotin operon repressor / biotin---[acetyl-CoA-carboxylase] ligase